MKYQYCVIYKQETQSEIEWIEELNNLASIGWRVVSVIGQTSREHQKAYLEKVIQ